MYPHDFMETNLFTYLAMVETVSKEEIEGFDSIVLPKGKYIKFEIQFDDIGNEIQKVYKYVKEHNIAIDYAFDFEDYRSDQLYSERGQVLDFCFKLKD